jgi:hypothetical protein
LPKGSIVADNQVMNDAPTTNTDHSHEPPETLLRGVFEDGDFWIGRFGAKEAENSLITSPKLASKREAEDWLQSHLDLYAKQSDGRRYQLERLDATPDTSD